MKKSFIIYCLLGHLLFSCTDLKPVDPLSFTGNCIELGKIEVLQLSAIGFINCFGDGIVEYGHVWSATTTNPTKEIRDGIDSIVINGSPLFFDPNTLPDPIQYTSTLTLANDESSFYISAYAEDVHGQVFYSTPFFFLKEITFNNTYWGELFDEQRITIQGDRVISLPDGTFMISGGFGIDYRGVPSQYFLMKIDERGNELVILPPDYPYVGTEFIDFYGSKYDPLELHYSANSGIASILPAEGPCEDDVQIWQLHPVTGKFLNSYLVNDSGNKVNVGQHCKAIFDEDLFGLNVPTFICTQCSGKIVMRRRREKIEGSDPRTPNVTLYSTSASSSLFIEGALKVSPDYAVAISREMNLNTSLLRIHHILGLDSVVTVSLSEYENNVVIDSRVNPFNGNEVLIITTDGLVVNRLKIKSDLSVVGQEFQLPNNVTITDGIILEDGGAVLMGNNCGDEENCVEQNIEQSLIRIDNDASELWHAKYNSDFGNFRSIDQTMNGGFIITGDKNGLLHIVRTNQLGQVF